MYIVSPSILSAMDFTVFIPLLTLQEFQEGEKTLMYLDSCLYNWEADWVDV